MPYNCVKVGDHYELHSPDRTLGKHKSRRSCERQARAVYANTNEETTEPSDNPREERSE